MGGMTPIALQALQAYQTIGTVAKFLDKGSDIFSDKQGRSSDLALSQLQQEQQSDARALAEKTALEKQEIAASSEKAELTRRRALKRAVAKQRAAYGGSGIGSGDGSSEALLLGLFEQSEEDKASSQKFDALKLSALDQKVSDTNRTNVLKRAQLAERSKLQNSSSTLEDISALFNIF